MLGLPDTATMASQLTLPLSTNGHRQEVIHLFVLLPWSGLSSQGPPAWPIRPDMVLEFSRRVLGHMSIINIKINRHNTDLDWRLTARVVICPC